MAQLLVALLLLFVLLLAWATRAAEVIGYARGHVDGRAAERALHTTCARPHLDDVVPCRRPAPYDWDLEPDIDELERILGVGPLATVTFLADRRPAVAR